MRDSVRKTWGVHRVENKHEVMPIFVVGYVNSLEVRRQIDKEVEQYKDLLVISAVDSYRNNTFKLFAAIEYAASPIECSTPDFVFLVDDDYIVHIPNLIKFATSKQKSDLVYEGFVFETSPFRIKVHKHSISLKEYPYSRYPPYVSAGAVFLSSATVQRFNSSMRNLRVFPFDDVFTGILAKTVDVPATHNENFIFWTRRVTREEWIGGVIAAHGFAKKNLEYEYNEIFG
uniref:Hexosyltransferase n=1 Tax=Caenorhabditis tropicalis TaxID=1561998 RepID=A0A1I7TUA7_9PELO